MVEKHCICVKSKGGENHKSKLSYKWLDNTIMIVKNKRLISENHYFCFVVIQQGVLFISD